MVRVTDNFKGKRMTGYSKLFGSIVASTIWREDDSTRLVWITMLAIKNGMDVVEASIPGLADMARVPMEDTLKALEKLKAPDIYSRSQDYEGRRIEAVDGGWKILNGEKYRQKMNQDERREYFRIKQQQHRERKKYQGNVELEPAARNTSSGAVELPPGFPKTEAEAIAAGQFVGVSAEKAVQVWNKAMSRHGYDAKGQPIRSFKHYLATEKGYDQERAAKDKPGKSKRGSSDQVENLQSKVALLPSQQKQQQEKRP